MSWEKSFKGKIVIVTGGGRGIGRAISVELNKLGAKVYAVSRNPDNLKSLKEECPSIQTVAVDLADWNKTRAAIEKIEPVDMLVNNAGVSVNEGFFEITPQDFDKICNVNLKAVINVSQVVAKKIIDAGKSGSIVNVSSLAGLKAMPLACAYSTLKASLDHLTKIMALELGPKNIRVNAINPSAVPTDMFAGFMEDMMKKNPNVLEGLQATLSRNVNPKQNLEMYEVINAVLFLLSDAAPMITGTCLALDGGYNIS